MSATGLDSDSAAQTIWEAIDEFPSEAAEAFLDDLNTVTPGRAIELVEEYACTLIGLATQAGSEKGCGKDLRTAMEADGAVFNKKTDPETGKVTYLDQAHHLIPSQLAAAGSESHPLVVRGQRDTDWDINGATNGLPLPTTGPLSTRDNLPKHVGPHPKYTRQVRAALQDSLDEIVSQYDAYYNTDLGALIDDTSQSLPSTPDVPLPSGMPTLQEAIETALDNVAADFKQKLINLGGGTIVNNL